MMTPVEIKHCRLIIACPYPQIERLRRCWILHTEDGNSRNSHNGHPFDELSPTKIERHDSAP